MSKSTEIQNIFGWYIGKSDSSRNEIILGQNDCQITIYNFGDYINILDFCKLYFGPSAASSNLLNINCSWTVENFGDKSIFKFLNTADAIVFKLRWL